MVLILPISLFPKLTVSVEMGGDGWKWVGLCRICVRGMGERCAGLGVCLFACLYVCLFVIPLRYVSGVKEMVKKWKTSRKEKFIKRKFNGKGEKCRES